MDDVYITRGHVHRTESNWNRADPREVLSHVLGWADARVNEILKSENGLFGFVVDVDFFLAMRVPCDGCLSIQNLMSGRSILSRSSKCVPIWIKRICYPKFRLFEIAVQHLRIHFVDIDLDGEMVVYECPSGAVLESQRKSFHLLIKALCRLKRRRNLE